MEAEKDNEDKVANTIICILRKPVPKRKFYDYALLEDMLKNVKYFKDKSLTIDEFAEISKHLRLFQVSAGNLVFDYKSYGDGFYIILQGKVSVQLPSKEKVAQNNIFIEVAQLNRGSYFGELASVVGRRSARIRAIEDSVFAILPNEPFERILKKKHVKILGRMADFLLGTPYFNYCKYSHICLIQFYFELRSFAKGQHLCFQGTKLEYIYLILSGEFELKLLDRKHSERKARMLERNGKNASFRAREGAKVLGRMLKNRTQKLGPNITTLSIKDEMLEVVVRKISKGDMYGQNELFNEKPQYAATLSCLSAEAKVYQISKENFNKWIRFLPNVNNYLKYESNITEKRDKEFIKAYKKINKNTEFSLINKESSDVQHSQVISNIAKTESTSETNEQSFSFKYHKSIPKQLKLEEKHSRNNQFSNIQEIAFLTGLEEIEGKRNAKFTQRLEFNNKEKDRYKTLEILCSEYRELERKISLPMENPNTERSNSQILKQGRGRISPTESNFQREYLARINKNSKIFPNSSRSAERLRKIDPFDVGSINCLDNGKNSPFNQFSSEANETEIIENTSSKFVRIHKAREFIKFARLKEQRSHKFMNNYFTLTPRTEKLLIPTSDYSIVHFLSEEKKNLQGKEPNVVEINLSKKIKLQPMNNISTQDIKTNIKYSTMDLSCKQLYKPALISLQKSPKTGLSLITKQLLNKPPKGKFRLGGGFARFSKAQGLGTNKSKNKEIK